MTKQNNEGWQEINPTTEEMWDPEEDKVIQGIYVSKKENVGPNESNVYVLNVGDKKIGIWGSTILDDRFKEIPLGCEVRIEYLGEQKTKKGNRTYQAYKVFYRPVPFKEVGDMAQEVNEQLQMIDKDEIPVINDDETDELPSAEKEWRNN